MRRWQVYTHGQRADADHISEESALSGREFMVTGDEDAGRARFCFLLDGGGYEI